MTRPAQAGRRRRMVTLLSAVVLAVLPACEYRDAGVVTGSAAQGSATTAPAVAGVEQLRATILDRYPHDPNAFTQGFELDGDVLLESTGLRGRSTIREVDIETGEVLRTTPVDASLFAEGLTVVGDRIIQLTWQAQTAIVYDRATLTEIDRYPYDTEGWGLCHDGARLVMSDGSSELIFRDSATFAETGRVRVTRDGIPVERLNELECVGNLVYANVWQSSEIMRIDPSSGEVTGVVDASELYQPTGVDDVLNGIAHDSETGEFLLTGKLWPEVYRVRFE